MKKVVLSLIAFLVVFSGFSSGLVQAQGYESGNLEKKLEYKFEYFYEEIGELTSEGYVIHDQKAFDKKVEEGDAFALELQSIMEKEKIKEMQALRNGEVSTFGAGSFASCVMDEFAGDFTNDVKLITNGVLYSYIINKQWNLAAQSMVKLLARQGFKTNVVTMAAQLSYYGFVCRGSW